MKDRLMHIHQESFAPLHTLSEVTAPETTRVADTPMTHRITAVQKSGHKGARSKGDPKATAPQGKPSTLGTLIPSHLHVLIVEDDPLDQAISYAAARQLKFRTEIASTAEEAIEKLKRTDADDFFDLVLIDYMLPGIDGVSVAQQLKTHLQLENPPPIVLVSALRKDDIIFPRSTAQPVDAYVNKPLSPTKIREVIADIEDEKSWAGIRWPNHMRDHRQLISNLRVLLVEDNPVSQKAAQSLLESRDADVTIADNGLQAVELIETKTPGTFDIILMDLDMPIMDGERATQNINSHATYKDLPIIALTSHTETETKKRCLQMGMRNYITKPIHPTALYAALIQELALPHSTPSSSLEEQ
ncbi:response regulator [Aurantivibrio plasticivorans]